MTKVFNIASLNVRHYMKLLVKLILKNLSIKSSCPTRQSSVGRCRRDDSSLTCAIHLLFYLKKQFLTNLRNQIFDFVRKKLSWTCVYNSFRYLTEIGKLSQTVRSFYLVLLQTSLTFSRRRR